MRAVLTLLLLRGSTNAIRTLAFLAAVFALLSSPWRAAGGGALQLGLRALLFAGIAGVAALLVLGLLWAVIWVIALVAPRYRRSVNPVVPRWRS